MKRDLALFRQVLLDVEAEQTSEVADQQPELYAGHVRLAREAGLLAQEEVAGGRGLTLFVTHAGYEALCVMRDEERFARAMEVADIAGGPTFDRLLAYLNTTAQDVIGEAARIEWINDLIALQRAAELTGARVER